MAISSAQFGSGSSKNFNAPADRMGSSTFAKIGQDRGSSTIGSMGSPIGMRTAGIGGFGGGGMGASGAGGLRTYNR
jgi:hypothetical protein